MPLALIVTALPHRLIVALALLFSLEAQALTLGGIQGAALIGRPLAVVVQVQLDPNQSITSACFEADVFHADTRQNPQGVQVRLEPSATANAAVLRITSSSRVDEPVVTIYVRAGCAQMSSRRYVLLADIVSEQVAAVPRVGAVPLLDGSAMAAPAAAGKGATAMPAAPAAASRPSGRRSDVSARAAAGNQPGTSPQTRRRDRAEPGRTAPARAAAGAPARAAAAAPARAAAVAPARAAAVASARAAAVASARAAAAARASPRAVPPPRTPAAAAAAATRNAGQSRLELDPLEVLAERVGTLESNTDKAVQLSEREALDLERLDRLDASLKALLVLAERNEAGLQDLRNRLEKAQADRFSNTVIYTLFGLLLLSLLAIAYLLARINREPETTGSRWFDAASDSSDPDSLPPAPAARSLPAELRAAAAPPAASTQEAAVAGAAALQVDQPTTDGVPIEPTRPMPSGGLVPAATAGNVQVDVSLVEMSESTFERLMQSGASPNSVRRVHETVPMAVAKDAMLRAAEPRAALARINADDLIDVRQRAEFFVTLGQNDQAVQVLEARIEQHAASCPQLFLDLFQLFHALGLKADFSQLRVDFLRLFNSRVPEFEDFDAPGRTLEDYPGAVDRLIRAWSRPTVLDTLEALIYVSPDATSEQDAFDLAAFRDLLMLHAVAQSVRAGAAGQSGAYRLPRAAVENGNQVDIDLSELFAPAAVATQVLRQTRAGAMSGDGSSSAPDVDVQLDVDAPTQGDTTPQSHNLIDFDLGDVHFAKKADKPF